MKFLKYLLIFAAFVALLFALQRLTVPKYMESVYDGALIAEYYREPKNHDVIFIGDCEVYENFSPVTLWDEYGYTSYIRGGPQQLMWHSYYLLEDTLRHETPSVVVFNVLAMQYGTPQSEAYNRLNIDGMRLSRSKIASARASMTDGENLLSYLFPLLRFHSRWSELTAEDLRYFAATDNVGHNGYLMRNDVKPVGRIPEGDNLQSYDFAPLCFEYLEKIADLCAENNIELLLIKAPSLYPVWYEQWDAQIADFATQHDLKYVNFLNYLDEIGLDFDTDSADGGLHFNQSGAEKLTRYLGAKLPELYPDLLTDRRGDAQLDALWAQKRAAYDAMSAAQRQEWETYGKLLTHTWS